jgi:MinD-like ATPase involved in chromosome partitioning or flagellar assembly
MRGVRIPHDLNGHDRFALGLSVTSLAGLLFGLLAAYSVLHFRLPLALRLLMAAAITGASAALAWLRPEGRSLIHWLMAAVEFKLGTKLETQRREASDQRPPRLTVLATADPGANSTDVTGLDPDIVELPTGNPDALVPPDDGSDLDPVPVYMGNPQVVTFFSAKGGTGRTALATEVASLLARKGRYRESPSSKPRPLRIALADFDRLSANVSVRVGLVQPTILDYLTETSNPPPDVLDYLRAHQASGLDVLLGLPKCLPAQGSSRIFDAAQALQVLAVLRHGGYQFVFVDLGSALGDFEIQVLEAADSIFCVVTPAASAIQDLYRTVEGLRRLGLGPKLRYVANKVSTRSDFSEPMSDLGGTLSAQIPYDPAFDLAENRHQPLILQGENATTQAIWRLAAAIYPALGYQMDGAHRRLSWLLGKRHAS